jgi:hypothetical protein
MLFIDELWMIDWVLYWGMLHNVVCMNLLFGKFDWLVDVNKMIDWDGNKSYHLPQAFGLAKGFLHMRRIQFFFELASRWKHVFNVRICKLDGDFVGHEPTS